MGLRKRAIWDSRRWKSLRNEPARELTERTLLVPALWSGSVEHYYHFLFGYLMPIVLWSEGTGLRKATVRKCGPLQPWLKFVSEHLDLEVIPPGLMLQRLVRADQDHGILAPLDDPRSFSRDHIARFAEITRAWAGTSDIRPVRVTIVFRGTSAPFFKSPEVEIPESAATRRTVPNLAELSALVPEGAPIDIVDLEQLSPSDQIAQLSSTRLLIAQHGAALASMIWMPPGAAVLEIQPPQSAEVATMFDQLAAACGLAYSLVPQEHDHAPVDLRQLSEIAVLLESKIRIA